MKLNNEALLECQDFFEKHPPYILTSRDKKTYDTFAKYAEKSYDGICFSFFAPDYYSPALIKDDFITINFDKILEPLIWVDNIPGNDAFEFDNEYYHIKNTGLFSKIAAKTDRFSDALIYAVSIFPQKRRPDKIGKYTVYRTDHRFHPHYRTKIYGQGNTLCADLPYGYLNIYANSKLTLSDRVHACAVTLAYGHPAMFFAETDRIGLLERAGAADISKHPVSLDMNKLSLEKENLVQWLQENLK